MASSTDRVCSTFDPREAISSISSVGDLGEPPRPRHHARIRGEDPVDIGINVAKIGPHRHRQGHGTGVGAAAAERGDAIAIGLDALKAGDDRDLPLFEAGPDLVTRLCP